MEKESQLKLFFSRFACCALIGLLLSASTGKKDYNKLFDHLKMDAAKYDRVYIMHFDFCSPYTKCRDTVELSGYLNGKNDRIALVVDTLYDSRLPAYVEMDRSQIFFVNRTWLQRNGLYTEYQQRLRISKKGSIKKRTLLQ